jgi:ribose 5-phosphate isomerase A
MSSGRPQESVPSSPSYVERHKRAAALAAAELVPEGAKLGLGTGSTVAYLLPALVGRELLCVGTSLETERVARELGLTVRDLDQLWPLDIAIDGADQIAPDGWLVKGGGGAHTRERIVAAAAKRFIVIASPEKDLPALRAPVPLEILRFGCQATLALIGDAELRDVPPTPDGNLIADYLGPVEDPERLAARLSATPGVVDHGLFPPELVSEILISRDDGIEGRTGAKLPV